MSNLTDFFPSGGGGGLTPKFEEFNDSGTFTPSQALIDAGGYIELFLVGGGAFDSGNQNGGGGGEVIIKKMYLSSTNGCSVTIAAKKTGTGSGNSSSFLGSSAGGLNVTSSGGQTGLGQNNKMGAGFSNYASSYGGSAGSGVLGYGAGGGYNMGVRVGKNNSGQGGAQTQSGSGYCLVKWYE